MSTLYRFEENRTRLRAVAYRMLGSVNEADDAVQEAWVRLNRTDIRDVRNLPGWLTTVVVRVALNMLSARRRRQEEPLEARRAAIAAGDARDPEHEAMYADSIGNALLTLLDTLTPAESLAFVLHDMFDVPFDEITSIVGRSPTAVRQLACRARRRMRDTHAVHHADLTRQRVVVAAFLAASRDGEFGALLRILDPGIDLAATRWVFGAGPAG